METSRNTTKLAQHDENKLQQIEISHNKKRKQTATQWKQAATQQN